MIVVFWVDSGHPMMSKFNSTDLTKALKFAEGLRATRKTGEPISHVCMQSEMEESVGEAGVSDANADYDWRKRREDPATFGRKE